MTIRVIIADDEVLMRSGLKLLIGSAPDIEIIAEASNGAEAVELTRELNPDLVLMDIRMPVMDGLEATRTLMADSSHPEILMLTAFGTDEFVLQALRSGAAGYLLKDTPPDELIRAVRAAADGTKTLSPVAVDSLLGQDPGSYSPPAGNIPPAGSPDPLAVLTAREREIAEVIAQGMSNAQAAKLLFVSVPTVKTHLARIFDKLEVRSRVQLALLVNESRNIR